MNTFITNAEDSEEVRDVIRILLTSTGEPYTLEQLKDGYEFMERLTKKEPMDIAILDIHMPGFSIIEAVKQLTRDWKQTYIIVVSADDDLDVILELQNKYHIWGYILKSHDFSSELTRLVYEAHVKVQDKNEYIERVLKEAIKLGDAKQ